MRAVVYDRYGPPDVQRLDEVKEPVPREKEVLVKVHATTVNRLDAATREANQHSGPAVSFLSRLVLASAGRVNASWAASSPGRSSESAPLSASSRSVTTSSALPDSPSVHTPSSSAFSRALVWRISRPV